jgi:hypothetical protein
MAPNEDNEFLELIPNALLTKQQKAFLPIGYFPIYMKNVPTYKLRRDPTRFDDIDWESYHPATIWRNNRTMICAVGEQFPALRGRFVTFTIELDNKSLDFAIFGLCNF